jgi:uncharacterized protein DUF3302
VLDRPSVIIRPLQPSTLDRLGDDQAIVMLPGQIAGPRRDATRGAIRLLAGLSTCALFVLAPSEARASLLSPELEDKMATVLALFILFIVPVVLIVLFWMVHILPERIAHKRHHPQFEAIRTLCLLSLVFGGLLWPLAWIWAYTKPVLHKVAYGTDKHSDAFEEGGDEPETRDRELVALRDRVARLEERGIPASDLKALRADIEALEAKFVDDGAR